MVYRCCHGTRFESDTLQLAFDFKKQIKFYKYVRVSSSVVHLFTCLSSNVWLWYEFFFILHRYILFVTWFSTETRKEKNEKQTKHNTRGKKFYFEIGLQHKKMKKTKTINNNDHAVAGRQKHLKNTYENNLNKKNK